MTSHSITRYAFDYLDGFIRAYSDDAYLTALLADRAEMIEQAHAAALAENELDNDDDDDDDDDDGCEGHESLSGAHMGESVYCDGTCIS